MPTTTITLSDSEVRQACAHWVASGCPVLDTRNVHLTIEPASNDPREPSFPTVSASVEIK